MKLFNILIVEDEAIIRLNLKMILKDLNCTTIGETSYGDEAINLAKTLKPDIICMDLKLQDEIDGFEAAKQIRAFYKPFFLFMSAYDRKKDAESQFNGNSKFLVKPIQREEIKKAISSIYV